MAKPLNERINKDIKNTDVYFAKHRGDRHTSSGTNVIRFDEQEVSQELLGYKVHGSQRNTLLD
jgi:hypothetical protein